MTAARSEQSWPAIERYRDVYGVMDFSLFEDCDGDLDEQRDCIANHFAALGHPPSAHDSDFLASLKPDMLNRADFLGDWFDPACRKLLAHGNYQTLDGRTLASPTLEDLDRARLNGGSRGTPELGERGQFAYAFYQTPYGLKGTGTEIQKIFDGIWATLSPAEAKCDYYDWSAEEMHHHFVPYFEAGQEWWGMFLFTIQIRTYRRLWVASASTTD